MTRITSVTAELWMDEDSARQLLYGLEAALKQKKIATFREGLEKLAAGEPLEIAVDVDFSDWKGLYGAAK